MSITTHSNTKPWSADGRRHQMQLCCTDYFDNYYRYSVRKSKGCLGITMNTETFLIFTYRTRSLRLRPEWVVLTMMSWVCVDHWRFTLYGKFLEKKKWNWAEGSMFSNQKLTLVGCSLCSSCNVPQGGTRCVLCQVCLSSRFSLLIGSVGCLETEPLFQFQSQWRLNGEAGQSSRPSPVFPS